VKRYRWLTGLTPEDRLAVETLYRAFNESNPDLMDQAVTPGWQDVPLAPHQAPGRDGIKSVIKEFVAAFPDLKITVHEIIGAPGRAAVRAEITGTHKGAGSVLRRPIKPTAYRSMSSTTSRTAASPILGTSKIGSAGLTRSARGR
jgi:predicted ester cyclase